MTVQTFWCWETPVIVSTSLLIFQPPEKRRCLWWSVGVDDGENGSWSLHRDFSSTVGRPSLPARSNHQDVHFHSPALWMQSHHCHSVLCVANVQHPVTPLPVDTPRACGNSLTRRLPYIHISAARALARSHTHTYTHKVHGTFCVAPVLFSSSASVSAAGNAAWPPPSCLAALSLSWSSLWLVSPTPGPGGSSWAGGCCSRSYRPGWARTAAGLALGSSGHNSWRRTHYRSSCRGGHRAVTAGVSHTAPLRLHLPCVLLGLCLQTTQLLFRGGKNTPPPDDVIWMISQFKVLEHSYTCTPQPRTTGSMLNSQWRYPLLSK